MSDATNSVARRAKPTELLSHWPKLIENLSFSPQEFYSRIEKALADRQVPDLQTSRVDWKEGGVLSARREYLRLQRERLIFDICGAPFGTGFFVSIWCGERPLRLGHLIRALILVGSGAVTWFGILQFTPRSTFYEMRRMGIDPGHALIAITAAVVLVATFLIVLLGPRLDNILIHTPVIGYFYERYFRKLTYYRVDRMCMYQQAVHAAVMQIIDEITKSQGIQPLSELERRPITREPVMRELFQQAGSNGHG